MHHFGLYLDTEFGKWFIVLVVAMLLVLALSMQLH